MNERTCIMTGMRGPADKMIRFVIGPGQLLVPDLKGNLPGRGAWLVISRRVLKKAIECNAFTRSLKQNARVNNDMLDILDHLLVKAALGSLSMARRSGTVITGAFKVNAETRIGNTAIVLHAQEAAEDSKRKIAQAIYAAISRGYASTIVATLFTSQEMSLAFGENNVIHAAVCRGLAANGFIKRAQQLIAYRSENVMNRDKDKAQIVKKADK